jgi:hypothetical protein
LVTFSRPCLTVSSGPLRCFPVAVLCLLTMTDSSSHELRFRFRVRIHLSHASRSRALRISFGFLSPSRPVHTESTGDEPSTARLTFRPQRFSHSRRFTPRCTSWACFIPLPRPGFHSRGFPRHSARTTSRCSAPLMSLAPLSCLRANSNAPDCDTPPSGFFSE